MHTWFVLLKLLLYLVAYTSIFVLWWYLVFHISKRVTRKNEHIIYTGVRQREKHKFSFSSVLWSFPWQAGKDAARSDPNSFPYKGIVCFTGEQIAS